MSNNNTRSQVLTWITTERARYADEKWNKGDNANLARIRTNAKDWDWWMQFITNYLSRAETLGLDTQMGRQAMGKAIVSALHCLERAIEEYGDMPVPGVPSGEIHDW